MVLAKTLATILLSFFFISACMKPRSYYPELDRGEVLIEKQKQQELSEAENKKKAEDKAKRLLKLQKRLNGVAAKIKNGGTKLCNYVPKLSGGDCIYEFYILDGRREANASADGKSIFITETMMGFASTDEELAIVLGHEYAHNLMGHIAAKKTNRIIGKVVGAVLDIAAGSQGVSTGNTFSNAGSDVANLSYSKEFEKEADYIGLYIAALAGYDIANAPQFWRKMSLKDSQGIYLGNTHPANPERYLALEKTVTEILRKQQNGAVLAPNLK